MELRSLKHKIKLERSKDRKHGGAKDPKIKESLKSKKKLL
jgi:hypothetical protein